MEWTEAHNVCLAREVRACEPWLFKPRTVDRGKAWASIADHLNDIDETQSGLKFSVSQECTGAFQACARQVQGQEKREARMSGVNIVDTELDMLLEEIRKEWEETEISDLYLTKKDDTDRAIGEEIRKKACEKLGETSKRTKVDGDEKKAKKRRSNETLDFLWEKMASRQTESERQASMQQEMIKMMQSQNNAILQILPKMADK